MAKWDEWEFIVAAPFGKEFTRSGTENEKLSINWFMPPISARSGGHITIFRFLRGLEARGFDCRVIIVNAGSVASTRGEAELHRSINEWFGRFSGSVHYVGEQVPPAHFAFATGWQSAYAVRQFRGAAQKCYFVQDFEPMFYPAGAQSAFAEETYRFGFTGFTAGPWLAGKLARDYGMTTYPFGFSYDRSLYLQKPRPAKRLNQLFCYVRPETPRRGWELVVLACRIIHAERPEITIILAGGEIDRTQLPFPAFAPGVLSQAHLAEIYGLCDCGLVVSMTNMSLMPLELMACGVPVVVSAGPHAEWLAPPDLLSVCRPTPVGLAEGVLSVFARDEARWTELSERGVAFAARTSWENEIDGMAAILNRMGAQAPRHASRRVVR